MAGDPYKSSVYRRNRLAVLEAAGYRCEVRGPACTGIATTADHVLPLALGGSHNAENLRAACRACQNRQGGQLRQALGRNRVIGRRSRPW